VRNESEREMHKGEGLPAALRIGGSERDKRLSGWARVSMFIYYDRDIGRDGLLMGLGNINQDGSYN